MNSENLIKLKEQISTKLLSFEDELEQLSKFDGYDISENIQSFLNNYKNTNEIDFELLNKFFDELPSGKVSSLEEYKKISQYLLYIELNNVNNIYEYDIKHCRSTFNKLIEEVNKLSSSVLTQTRQHGFALRVLQNQIKTYQEIDFIIYEYSGKQSISGEQFDTFCEFIRTNPEILTPKETVALIAEITKNNAEAMQRRIELEQKKQKNILDQKERQRTLEIEKKKAEQTAILNKKQSQINQNNTTNTTTAPNVNKTLDEIETPDKSETSNTKTANYGKLNENEQKLYNRAKEIADIDKCISSSVNVAFSMLSKELTWKDRRAIYDTLTINLDKVSLISQDLQTIILPMLEEKTTTNQLDNEIFYLLNKIILYYDEVISSNKERHQSSIDYTVCLQNFNMTSELEFCYQVDNLLETCLELKTNNPQLFYSTNIQMLVKDLKKEKEVYEECVLECYREGLELGENKELLELLYSDLTETYNALHKLYETNIYSIPTKQEELINLAKTFYDNSHSIENIFLFVNDDGSITSVIEDDIENDKTLGNRTFSSVLSKLQETVSDPLIASGNHKVKRTDIYSKDFLETHKVKSIRAGEARIFYSRFNSTLGKLFGGEDPHIIFLYSVGFGGTDDRKKVDVCTEALKRCSDDEKNIEYYRELLNTDWDSLLNNPTKTKEFQQQKQKVIEYLNRQYLKLGHFIKTTEEKKKTPENEKGAK